MEFSGCFGNKAGAVYRERNSKFTGAGALGGSRVNNLYARRYKMAFDNQFLGTFFQGIENAEEQIGKIMSEHEADVTGLKRTNGDLKTEKDKLADQHKAVLEQKEALEATIKELNEKLESGLPDKEKQFFQAEIEKYKTNAANAATEMNRQIAEREAQIKELEADHHNYICQADFNELVNSDPGIIPELRESLRKLFFVDNQFEWVEVNGTKQLLNKASKNMKDALTAFLETSAGQHFRMARNNGGGAAGSNGTRGNGNILTRQQFDALTPLQKQEFMAKQGKIT
jgi:DNA repair exonuclease SbcCD ATPase subunit